MKRPTLILIENLPAEQGDGSVVRAVPLTRQKLPPAQPYRSPDDVPVPLQWNIKYAVESGLSPAQLALIYEIPVEWVEQFMTLDAGE